MNETPWSCSDEWRSLRSHLYSPDTLARRSACHRLSAWHARGGVRSIPLRCAHELTEALLLEGSVLETRLALGSAFVRFVNAAVDDGQRGEYAQSVSLLAGKMGLDKWLVDVRHEATHGQLPGLQVLRLAVRRALEWLEGNYFELQEKEWAKHERGVVDDKVKALVGFVVEGKVKRQAGPVMLSEREQSCAQQVMEALKGMDCTYVAKSLAREMFGEQSVFNEAETESWQDWEDALRLFDDSFTGGGIDAQTLLKSVFRQFLQYSTPASISLLNTLLARRFQSKFRPSLAKRGTKNLSATSESSWSNADKAFMSEYTPNPIFYQELQEFLKLALGDPKPTRREPLLLVVLPAVLAANGQEGKLEEMFEKITTLFEIYDSNREMFLPKLTKGDITQLERYEKFCAEQKSKIVVDENDEKPSPTELIPGGLQEWVEVNWTLPIGTCPNDAGTQLGRCPGLSLAPFLNAHLIPQHAPAATLTTGLAGVGSVYHSFDLDSVDDAPSKTRELTSAEAREIAKKVKMF